MICEDKNWNKNFRKLSLGMQPNYSFTDQNLNGNRFKENQTAVEV